MCVFNVQTLDFVYNLWDLSIYNSGLVEYTVQYLTAYVAHCRQHKSESQT